MLARPALYLLFLVSLYASGQTAFRHDLQFKALPSRWDEALPLGNGMVGALIWEKDGKLRLSLDRADLWDLRPTADLDEFDFAGVKKNLDAGTYEVIQKLGDVPYERDPAPTKIPGAALEFDLGTQPKADNVHLYIKQGLASILSRDHWTFTSFIHPTLPLGWFRISRADALPNLIPPRYSDASNVKDGNSVEGQGLARLGYPQGQINKRPNEIHYVQPGWNGFEYEVSVRWKVVAGSMEGVWAITSTYGGNKDVRASSITAAALARGYNGDRKSTTAWWNSYWSKSSISLPDSVLERQWYLEQYKLGCVARADAPPITLQAVWTADNGNLPPWKGDIHNDLNIQLSYWPAYSGNHLEEAAGMVNWLHRSRPVFERWTKSYFKSEGLNVPGVTTLDGEAMGGWIQYSLSPTTAGWLGHHFYLHWRYTMDRKFLGEKAYPWVRDFARFIASISVTRSDGLRQLPLSSSPEFYDNSPKAWFRETTNYDLAIIRWTYEKAAEMADELGLSGEAKQWRNALAQWPPLSIGADGGLQLAPGLPYPESHRHFSHLMGIHPLGLLSWDNADDRRIIEASIRSLEAQGTKAWVGYSFAWLGNLYARMGQGEEAHRALETFARCFCLSNSFHANGDQCGGKYSGYTYRPFTLEGNFAFAAGVQEMLLQSHDGVIRLFPAVPESWNEVSFFGLRSEGAHIVSAKRAGGLITEVTITSGKDGLITIDGEEQDFHVSGADIRKSGYRITLHAKAGQKIQLTARP
ncbi:MAG: hypothetical protein JNN04_11910 [Cyclobacteriaceae bacterium]|nr:hypothetical protein [Cyclobacteriaceae bacterium]